MSKFNKLLITFFITLTLFFLFPVSKVNAQCACDCICVDGGNEVGSCSCDDPQCSIGSPSMTIWGPNCSSATPPPSGGGGGSCSYTRVDCPGGATADSNQVVDSFCSTGSFCSGPGTAQSITGTCCNGSSYHDQDNPCNNRVYNTYACCAAGTVSTPTTVTGSNYTYTNPCYDITPACSDNDDTLVSSTQNSTYCARECTGTCGSEANNNLRCCQWDYFYNIISTCTTVTTTYSCVPTCDVNSWGAWGACSATCGGGVQTRTNACGTPQSQACNTQSCQGPWWQIKDGDITTSGDLVSDVGNGQLFDIVGLGGFAGVPVYGNAFNLTSTTDRISATMWNSNTTTIQSRVFNYSYFDNLIPSDVNFNDVSTITTGGTPYSDGYEWYKATSDVSTSGDINIGSRKVILFIENGNFNINGKINLTDGVGFFGVFVDGNIVVSPSVTGAPSIEGVYLSDGSFSTGAGTSQLHLRGSVATFGTVNLERDLVNDITAAELFEFAPDQMLLFPEKLMFRRTKWTEVAP